ncbi:uncharacterized protein LOC135151216 [Daucus carota subsp. sativus]|uniref:uncharacterized protein LOC135151216 n=1 Tax=Daucus carota subsp. sativus TaxID=79200 RepID=UPI003083A031
MAKRNQRCSVNQAAIIAKNLAHPSHWAVTKLLGSSEHFFSSMSAASLTDAKRLFRADIVAVVPESPVEADWVREGWTCFYYYPFDLGLTFPFSRLVNDLLSSLNIAHGQLMPSTWRMLACLDAVEDKHRLGINVDVLKFAYTTKKYGCRVGLINKMRGEPLILNNESVHDRGWNKDFFFAEIVTLESSDSFLLDHWTDEKELSFELEEGNIEAEKVVSKILELPIAERLWPNCLGRPIKNASFVDVSEFLNKMNKAVIRHGIGSPEKAMPQGAAARTRSKLNPKPLTRPSLSVLSVSSDSGVGPTNGGDCELDSGLLYDKEYKPSVIRPLGMSCKDLFVKRGREDRSNEAESSKSPALFSPCTSQQAKKVKLNHSADTFVSGSSAPAPAIMRGYEVDAHPTHFAPLLRDLLFSQTMDVHSTRRPECIIEESSGYIFHALQTSLAAQTVYERYSRAYEELEREHGGCVARLQATRDALEKERRDFDKFASRVKTLEREMHEGAQRTITQQAMRARVETMLEFRRGELSSKDIGEAIRIYNGAYPGDSFATDGLEGGANVGRSSQDIKLGGSQV